MQNKKLLDEMEMLCTMNEAAEREIQRLRNKLSRFVEDIRSSGAGIAAVHLSRGLRDSGCSGGTELVPSDRHRRDSRCSSVDPQLQPDKER